MKDRLKRYRRMLVEIEIEEERRNIAEKLDGFAGSRAIGLINARIRRLRAQEAAELRALMAIIEAIPEPEQRQVLFARYIDGHSWGGVAQILFGRKSDYWLRRDSYERRVYRIHGNALANANRIAGMNMPSWRTERAQGAIFAPNWYRHSRRAKKSVIRRFNAF